MHLDTQKFIAYGSLGLLVEVVFTGIHAFFFLKSKNAYGRVSLWMFPVWGSGALILEQIRDWSDTNPNLWWHITLRAILLTVVIYILEFVWGLFFEYFPITKRCVWKYMDPKTHEKVHRFSIMGLIRLDYAIYWYALAIIFDVFSPKFRVVLNTMSRL